MARVTIIVSGLLSSTFRTLHFARDLVTAGHDVVFVGPQATEDVTRHNGFDYITIADPWINPWHSPLPRPSLRDRFSLAKRRQRSEAAIARYNVDELPNVLAQTAPDLVIINGELHAHIVVTHAAGYKVALVSSIYGTAPSASSPPLHYAQVPGRGVTGGRYATGAAWAYCLLRKQLVLWRNGLRDWGGDQVSALAHLARARGTNIKSLRRRRNWQMPWAYRLPTMFMLPEALDLPKKHWPETRFIGGATTIKKQAAEVDLSEFDTFLGPLTAGQSARILITFGSFLKPKGATIAAMYEAVRAHPEWRVLFVVKEKFWSNLPSPPPNLQLAGWAPLNDLIPQADVIVNHAGNATVLEAIAAKVPMLLYPINNDQFGCAARVAYHNLGIYGKPQDTAQDVADHIATLLADQSIAASLEQMQSDCSAELDTQAGVRAVEDVLNGRWLAS